tara:strand:- start:1009 stop:1239 length:231 start_codon:yes stop_codon:yes gene_type:complete
MKCIKCKNDIPPKRLVILPSTKTCVNCSTTTPKRGVPIMKGKGDHTWVELGIMEQGDFEKFERTYNNKRGFDKLIN